VNRTNVPRVRKMSPRPFGHFRSRAVPKPVGPTKLPTSCQISSSWCRRCTRVLSTAGDGDRVSVGLRCRLPGCCDSGTACTLPDCRPGGKRAVGGCFHTGWKRMIQTYQSHERVLRLCDYSREAQIMALGASGRVAGRTAGEAMRLSSRSFAFQRLSRRSCSSDSWCRSQFRLTQPTGAEC